FQGENRCAFTQDHASAISIKRAAFFWRRRLKGIKPDKDQFRECVVTTGQYALITARSHAFERMADRVCARGACIRNYLARCRNSECFMRINHRLLCRLICDTGWRMSQAAMPF